MGTRSRLVAVALLVVLAAGAPSARGGEEAPLSARLGETLARLASPHAETRRQALARLRGLVREDAGACRRAVRPLADVLRRRGPQEGAAAVALLAALPDDRARRYWLEALDPEAHPTLFVAAVEAAATRCEDGEAGRALLERARDGREPPARRALALEALGALGGPAARHLLTRPLTDTDGAAEGWLLASARALGLRRLGREAVPALIDLLGHDETAPRVHAWEALRALTRQTLPVEKDAWATWWAAQGGKAPAAPPPGDEAEADRYATPVPVHVPTYYGVPIDRPRSHVVFCLDVSQSMYGRGIRQARGELTRTLLSFPASYAFDVLAFNENVHPFAGELLPAHPVVKSRALAWLAALETISYTNLYDAVELAFGYAGVGPRPSARHARLDAVFLLSDGAPNRGRYRREDRVVAAIARLSRRRIPVHAVAAGEEVFPLLRRIAAETGGTFVDAFEFDE